MPQQQKKTNHEKYRLSCATSDAGGRPDRGSAARPKQQGCVWITSAHECQDKGMLKVFLLKLFVWNDSGLEFSPSIAAPVMASISFS